MSARSRPPNPRVRPAGAALRLLLAAVLAHAAVPAATAELPGQVSVHPAYPSFLFYHLAGPYFLAGPGDPEGFLYRGTRNADGTRDGDQQALIEKLAPTGANSIYLMAVRSHGGDGDATENPFVDSDPANGLSDALLDQWQEWFDQMDAAGITIFFFLYDDGALIWNTGDTVGAAEAAFVRALVDRFEHYRHLIWVIAEEYQERYSSARISALASEIKSADDHDHPVAVHKLSGLDFSEFADDPALDQFAIQYNVASAENLHDGLELAWADALGRYNLNLAEAAAWGTGSTSRRKAWAAALAGAYVMVYEMDIAGTPVSDLEDLGRLRAFMESTDFYTMEPRDDLAAGDTEYLLAREAKSYILYAGQGTGSLGVQDFHAGTYRRRWIDAETGVEVLEQEVELTAGPQAWPRPAGIGSEAAVYALRLDGPNDRPVAVDQQLATGEAQPLDVKLAYLDPDGPGPYAYAITTGPSNGTLSGTAPDFVYTPDGSFTGVDSLTWTVDDGLDLSEPATVTIVVSANRPPTADDFALYAPIDTPVMVPFANHAGDSDGDPLTFVIDSQPTHGQLTESGGVWTYTPDSGFSGVDLIVWRADDGADRSEFANASISINVPVFLDDFERPDSDEVGNGWAEIEGTGRATIAAQALTFDSADEVDRPLVRRSFAVQSSGTLTWSFDLSFQRTGNEGSYAFHLQLGDGAAMADSSPDTAGVAVNLLWSGPSHGFSSHETLAYSAGGASTELATVSGRHGLSVEVDLDTSSFELLLDGTPIASGLPFDHEVPIDTLRFFADGLNAQNFLERSIDNVRITAPCAASGGAYLELSHDVVSSTVDYQVCQEIEIGPNWSVVAPGEVTLEAATVTLRDGVMIGDGARLTIR